MNDDRWRDRVYVRDSQIDGMGVFARRNFATGETVFVRGEMRPVTPDQPLDESAGELERHCDWIEGGKQVYLAFPERHVNHSCEPNAFVRFEGDGAVYVALQPLHANEEITTSYSVNLWDGEAWECSCGSERCLGTVPGSFYELPLERQIELMPLLAAWFIREHPKEYAALREAAGLPPEDDD